MSPPVARLDELDSVLAHIREIGEGKFEDSEAVSYGLLPGFLSDYWDDALARLQELLNRCARLAEFDGFVESGDQARSAVGWRGDLATVWSASSTPEQRQAHFASIDAHLRYRTRMVLIVTASVQAVATLCAAAASPLLAPAAFRAVMKLVSELQQVT